jgi:hypothetical protein
MYTFILILILIFIICYNVNFETFSNNDDIVGYNNTNVRQYTIDTKYSKQTNNLKSLLDAVNQNNVNVSLEGTLYNKNIDFPLSTSFKTLLSSWLVKNKIFGEKVYISSDILNLYTKDIK